MLICRSLSGKNWYLDWFWLFHFWTLQKIVHFLVDPVFGGPEICKFHFHAGKSSLLSIWLLVVFTHSLSLFYPLFFILYIWTFHYDLVFIFWRVFLYSSFFWSFILFSHCSLFCKPHLESYKNMIQSLNLQKFSRPSYK